MKLVGCVDLVSPYSVAGWAADLSAPDRELDVLIWVGGRLLGEAKADRLRRDLQNLGAYGAGRHGFVFAFGNPLSEDQAKHVRVVFAGSDQVIPLGEGAERQSASSEAAPADPACPTPVAGISDKDVPASPEDVHFIVHIGPHKTASSYLQARLSKLASSHAGGFSFPGFWTFEAEGPSHRILFERLEAGNEERLAEDFLRVRQSGSVKVVISSEDLSSLESAGICLLKKLIGESRITVVYYVRRWSAKLVSNWKESLLNGSTGTLPEYLSENLANPLASSTINFGMILHKFANVFGRENLRLVSYDELVETNTEFATHFISSFIDPSIVPLESAARIHESSDFIDAEIIRALNLLEKAENMRPSAGRQFFGRRKEFDAGKLRDIMGGFTKAMEFEENVSLLRQILVGIFSEFGETLVEPKPRDGFFRGQPAEYRYITDDYLVNAGALQALHDLRSQISFVSRR